MLISHHTLGCSECSTWLVHCNICPRNVSILVSFRSCRIVYTQTFSTSCHFLHSFFIMCYFGCFAIFLSFIKVSSVLSSHFALGSCDCTFDPTPFCHQKCQQQRKNPLDSNALYVEIATFAQPPIPPFVLLSHVKT